MPNLTVVFIGSCAYLPNSTYDDLRVVLPDGTKGYKAKLHGQPIVGPHTAFLAVPVHHKPTGRAADFRYYDRELGQDMDVFILTNETLTLPSSDSSLTLDMTPLSDPTDPTKEPTSLRWLAQMASVCENAAPKPWAKYAALVRVLLTAGQVTTKRCADDVMTFSPLPESKKTYKQCFASEIQLTTLVKSATVVISSNGGASLTLQPVNGQVYCEIGNETLDKVLMPDQKMPDRDYDFELFFSLKAKPSTADLHIPSATKKSKGKKIDCRGAMFAPGSFSLTTKDRAKRRSR
jgi:hypothetical protein